nr:uncharacterized protein LOC27209084 isoform X1 [Drosophila simulans]
MPHTDHCATVCSPKTAVFRICKDTSQNPGGNSIGSTQEYSIPEDNQSRDQQIDHCDHTYLDECAEGKGRVREPGQPTQDQFLPSYLPTWGVALLELSGRVLHREKPNSNGNPRSNKCCGHLQRSVTLISSLICTENIQNLKGPHRRTSGGLSCCDLPSSILQSLGIWLGK